MSMRLKHSKIWTKTMNDELQEAYKKGYSDGYLKARQEEFEKRSKSGKKRWAGVSLEDRMKYAKWMRRGKCLDSAKTATT